MIRDENRCEATYPLPGENGVVTEMLRCTRHRLHVHAPIEGSRPHSFTFEVES